MRKRSVAVAVLACGALLAAACGKSEKKEAATPAAAAAKPAEPTPEGPLAVDPATVDAKTLKPGLKITVFGNNRFAEPVTSTSTVSEIDFDCDKNPYNGKEMSFREEGYLKVDKDGAYCMQIASDDESRILLNGKPAVVNVKSGTAKERIVNLKAGYYALTVEYQNNVGPACLKVKWALESCGAAAPIPAGVLSH